MTPGGPCKHCRKFCSRWLDKAWQCYACVPMRDDDPLRAIMLHGDFIEDDRPTRQPGESRQAYRKRMRET